MKESTDKGLLVVSFGTTHNDTCGETIGAIEEHLAKAMPDRRLYRGWTSGFIIRKLKERDGVQIDTVGEALDRMASEGIRDLLVVPTHLLPGAEYDKMMATLDCSSVAHEESSVAHEERSVAHRSFEKVAVSRPLLDTDEDLKRLAEVIAGELLRKNSYAPYTSSGPEVDAPCTSPGPEVDAPCTSPGPEIDAPCSSPGPEVDAPCALVLMGHGSADKPEVNKVYVKLEEEFRSAGYDNVFVGTVEGSPTVDEVTDRLMDWTKGKLNCLSPEESDLHTSPEESEPHHKAARFQTDEGEPGILPCHDDMTVLLAPLMIVAGDHAINDMAGDSPDSWKNRIAASLSATPDAVTPGSATPDAVTPGSTTSGAVTPGSATPDAEVSAEVIPIVRGLGSYAGVQEMFLEKARNAKAIHPRTGTRA